MKKIAILGASYLQLPVIVKANEMGLETHVFAIPEGAIAKDICHTFYPISTLDKESILEKCIALKIDGILTIASDIAANSVNYVADKMGLNGNPLGAAKVSTHKLLMKDTLRRNELPVADYIAITDTNLDSAAKLGFPLIIKPSDRSGSMGVTKVNSVDELSIAYQNAKQASLSGSILAEAFINAREVSVESISYKGVHKILAVTDKVTTGAPHFVEVEQHQPSTLPAHQIEELYRITLNALDALGIVNGASHSEFFILEDLIYINEIGGRMGGDFIGSHLVELSTGYDFLKATIEVALNLKPTPTINSNHYSGVIYKWVKNSTKFDEYVSDGTEIIQKHLSNSNLTELSKSGEREDYIIYRSKRRITFTDE